VAAREIKVLSSVRKRDKGILACFCGGRRRTVDIENGSLRVEKFEGDIREFKSLEGRTGR